MSVKAKPIDAEIGTIAPGCAVGKTIVLACQQGFEARYVLRSSLFDGLHRSGANLVALVPNPEEPYLAQEFAGKNVVFERLEIAASLRFAAASRLQRLFRVWRAYGIPADGDLAFLNDKVESTLTKPGSRWKRFAVDAGLAALHRSATLRRRLIELETRLYPGEFYAPFFERYRPDLVVTPTPGYLPYDTYLLRQAHRWGCATAAVLCGWDRSVSGGLAGFIPDTIVAWSEPQREELTRHQGIAASRVFVSGAAIFDDYLTHSGMLSREKLFAELGLEPGKRLIVFGPKSPHTYPNHLVAEMLARVVNDGSLSEDCSLVIRIHPLQFRPDSIRSENGRRALEEFHVLARQYPNVRLSIPTILSDSLRLDMPRQEMLRVGALMRHADVVVTIFSTLVLEAALFDTPVVNVCFDPPSPPDRTYYRYRPVNVDANQSHNRRVSRSGATRFAHDEGEVIRLINLYLAQRQLDRDARRQLVLREAGPFDGRAGARAAAYLLRLVGCATK